MSDPSRVWRRCSSCKAEIAFGAAYWTCSVSTCNRKRTGLAFCSVSCWDAHLPVVRHREAWAEEKTAPARGEAPSRRIGGAREGRRRIARPVAGAPEAGSDAILIVASRLKDYVRAKSGYQTSDRILAPLSDLVRRACDEAIENARREERRTVLDRDLKR